MIADTIRICEDGVEVDGEALPALGENRIVVTRRPDGLFAVRVELLTEEVSLARLPSAGAVTYLEEHRQ